MSLTKLQLSVQALGIQMKCHVQVEKAGKHLRVQMSSQFENVDRAVDEIRRF